MKVEEIDRIDSRLALLGRGVGAMRLRIGEGLLRLDESGIRALGFPSLESYAREALGRSGRWSADARSLARRLSQLPRLRAALVSGRLTTSMVELVCRVATPDDEADWVDAASHMTVRALRVRLKAERLADNDDAMARATITVTVDRIDALAFERARAMVEALGATRGDGAIEAMLAEGLGELIAANADLDLPSGIGGAGEETRAERAELALLREQREAAAESAIPPETVTPVGAMPDAVASRGDDIASEHASLRAAARELARRDLELAALARRAVDHELWRTLRFASFDHYCRERIGLSPTSIATRVALARRLDALPEIEDALGSGRIGYEAATLIARVASAGTVGAWLDRAEVRTVKHLREAVEAIELLARIEGHDATLGPPDTETLEAMADVERAAIGAITGESQMSGSSTTASESAADLPKTTLRIAVSEDVAGFWRALERLHGQLAAEPDASFVAFLARAVSKSWAGALPGSVAYAHIYHRDRWRCASPVCRSRNVTPHHIVFRSRGGGEESGNLVSLCETCHLELVHFGRLEVGGDARLELHWRARGWRVDGRTSDRVPPELVVERREHLLELAVEDLVQAGEPAF